MTTRTSSRTARTHSSTTYWMAGLSTTGSISLGVALVAGRNLVPRPAAGMTALVTRELMSSTLTRHVGGRRRCRRRHLPLVATAALRGVERFISGPDETNRAVRVRREHRDPDRHRHGQLQPADGERRRSDSRTDAVSGVAGPLRIGFGQYDDELLASVARDDVDLADLG